jgi:hypothetical protein
MSAQQRGDLRIERETTLAELPRGRDGREVLRVRHVEATTPEGRPVSWTDIREWYRAEEGGDWQPGKKGISIKSRELAAIRNALSKATGERTTDPSWVAGDRDGP